MYSVNKKIANPMGFELGSFSGEVKLEVQSLGYLWLSYE